MKILKSTAKSKQIYENEIFFFLRSQTYEKSAEVLEDINRNLDK